VQKKQLNFFLLFAIEVTVLSVFLQKKGLGRLGVNSLYQHTINPLLIDHFRHKINQEIQTQTTHPISAAGHQHTTRTCSALSLGSVTAF